MRRLDAVTLIPCSRASDTIACFSSTEYARYFPRTASDDVDSTGSDDEVEVPDSSVADDEDADWDDDDVDSTGSDDEVEVPDSSVADDEDADWDDDDADWSDDIDKHGLFLGRPTARGTGLAGNGPDVHALGNL